MSRIIILSPYEIKKFDNVPLFNDEERHKFFYISASIKVKLNNLSANDSKVGFVLQLGYFKATGKFYHKYNDDDKLFVSQLLAINLTELNNYTKRIRLNHKSEILGMLNHKQFNKNVDLFEEHIENLVSKQMHPRKIIFAMVDLLRARKIEVPNYDKFVRSITTNINKYENNLVLKVADNITDDNKYTLNSLLESDDSKSMITKLKVINQSVRPSRIKQSISGFILIKKLYEDNEKLIKLLDLSREATKYYANWIIKAKISQIKTITDHNTRYLYLLAFLDHQYKNWQDIFIDTILKVNQQYLNKIEILAKESKNELADRNNNLLDFVLRDFDKQSDIIDQVRNIIYDEKIDNNNKVNKLKIIVSKEVKKNHDNSKIDELKQNLIYYKQQEKQNFVILNKLSRALQNRLADIIKHIEFVAMDEFLNKAILYYQNNNLTKSAPNSFLEQSEIEAVYNNSFNSNLYKILLFMKIAEAIKSGEISLANSYRYMSIESYLIKEEIWQAQKEELLKKLDLQEFMDIDKILKKLRTELDYKYSTVNKNLKTNKYIKLKEDGDFSLLTPPVDKPDYDSIYKIMEHDNYISILQMMSEVNNITDFSNNFKHHKIKGVQQKIADEVIFAGIFALGSNIGIHKLASTAIGVNYNNLLHGINWHFSLENLYAANNVLIDFMSKMWLPNQFKKEQNFLHTSSDGKKKCVSAESLNSNYSYKYFGHGRGSNIYTFIDERNILFYSTVFSSSERDAAYVIDGLQHNSSIKSDIHSTDTEGYTELVFGISYLIKISYGPRIKNLGKQLLTSFDKQNPEYQISPDRYVNEKYIKQYWDTILRLIATILLREEKASTIMKRLASYDKQHKLYAALKEFGRIIKTCFILDIIDNVKLRQQIEKQLNKSELSNKFQGAISFANQELVQIDRDEQEKAAICQVILQNIIVLWNYVKLTKLIMISDNKQRPELMENIMNGSILTWKHVNMLGTYDFSNLAANENINVDELLNFNIA